MKVNFIAIFSKIENMLINERDRYKKDRIDDKLCLYLTLKNNL